MLEQYRKDLPMEEKDLLSDHEQMSKRKLLFIVAGAALALLFFLFLTGIFRSDTDSLAVNDSRPEAPNKDAIAALEEKLQATLLRLDALEKNTPFAVPVHQEVAISQGVDSQPPEQSFLSAAPISSVEDAVSMTDQSMRHFIHNEAQEGKSNPAMTSHDEEEPANKREIAAKPSKKTKKGKEKSVMAVGSGASSTHIVQKGDTLSKISMRYFGTANRWKAIYDANRNRISNINQLRVGTALVIPKEGRQGAKSGTQEAQQ